MDAAAFGHLKVVETLLQTGIEVNAQDKAGNTALGYAKKGGFDSVMKVLDDAGAVETVK
jgi:ankyrin repeat protein